MGRLARWDVALAAFAWLSWFGGHFAGAVSDVAIPAWVVTGIALGLLRPRFGLLVTILVVPYLGGAADPPQAELLRVIPILGAAVRLGVDRLRGKRTFGAPRGEMVGLALVASFLFLLTAFTAYRQSSNAGQLVLAALPWLLGAPVAFLATWITAAHDAELPDGPIVDAVLVSTVFACLFALVAWWGAPWTAPFAYPAGGGGRLSAFGFPTPTGIGLAIALPFAVAAARRRHVLAGLAVFVLVLATVVLTGSRGPLIALGVGGFVALAVSGGLNARTILGGAGIALVAAAALVAVKYGTTPQRILDTLAAVTGGDLQRVQSWRDAIEATLRDPISGGGWGSLARVEASGSVGITASHNMILSAFADGGLPLGITFAGVVLYSAFTMWSNRRWIAPYAIAGATALLVTGLWDVPNLRSYGAVMGGLALGLVARKLSRPAAPREPTGKRRAGRTGGDGGPECRGLAGVAQPGDGEFAQMPAAAPRSSTAWLTLALVEFDGFGKRHPRQPARPAGGCVRRDARPTRSGSPGSPRPARAEDGLRSRRPRLKLQAHCGFGCGSQVRIACPALC